MAAFDAATGQLMRNWSPRLNGPVRAIAVTANGRSVLLGGDFTTADGLRHKHLASIGERSGLRVSGSDHDVHERDVPGRVTRRDARFGRVEVELCGLREDQAGLAVHDDRVRSPQVVVGRPDVDGHVVDRERLP